MRRWKIAAAAVVCGMLAGCADADDGAEQAGEGDAGVVNVYSHRHYDTDQQLFDRFTEQTGIAVNVVTAGADELIARLESEGASSPADLLITVDAGRLHRAKEAGLLQPVVSEELEAAIPSALRDPDGYWFGLTQRARVIAYAPDRIEPTEIATYASLAEPALDDRVVIRSSDNVYNQSLLASIIAHDGEAAALEWARGVAGNMARAPSGGDTDQLKAVAAGTGDVAVVNTYYLARLASSDDAEDRRIAGMLDVVFPNQGDRGTHVNVSGAGVTASSANRDNAIRLLEFLVSEDAQRMFAEGSYEYPVRDGVAWAPVLQEWGEFEADDLNLARLGELNAQAVRIFDEAGWR